MNINLEEVIGNTKLPIPLRDKNGKQIGEIAMPLSIVGGVLKGRAIMYPEVEQIEINLAVEGNFESKNETTRTVLHNQYQEASQQIISHLSVQNQEEIKTEDDILEAAIGQTSM